MPVGYRSPLFAGRLGVFDRLSRSCIADRRRYIAAGYRVVREMMCSPPPPCHRQHPAPHQQRHRDRRPARHPDRHPKRFRQCPPRPPSNSRDLPDHVLGHLHIACTKFGRLGKLQRACRAGAAREPWDPSACWRSLQAEEAICHKQRRISGSFS